MGTGRWRPSPPPHYVYSFLPRIDRVHSASTPSLRLFFVCFSTGIDFLRICMYVLMVFAGKKMIVFMVPYLAVRYTTAVVVVTFSEWRLRGKYLALNRGCRIIVAVLKGSMFFARILKKEKEM